MNEINKLRASTGDVLEIDGTEFICIYINAKTSDTTELQLEAVTAQIPITMSSTYDIIEVFGDCWCRAEHETEILGIKYKCYLANNPLVDIINGMDYSLVLIIGSIVEES